jgi:hypothetical protein
MKTWAEFHDAEKPENGQQFQMQAGVMRYE